PGRGAPHFPDDGWPGRGAPHFPDGAAGQRRSSLPRWGGRAEALLTSQTGRPGRGAPHFPDDGWPGRGAPHFPDRVAGQRRSSLPRRGGRAEALLTSQTTGGRAEALLTSQTGRPGRGAPHFPDGAAGQRRSSLPRRGSRAEALLTSQTGRPGRGAPRFPDGTRARIHLPGCRFNTGPAAAAKPTQPGLLGRSRVSRLVSALRPCPLDRLHRRPLSLQPWRPRGPPYAVPLQQPQPARLPAGYEPRPPAPPTGGGHGALPLPGSSARPRTRKLEAARARPRGPPGTVGSGHPATPPHGSSQRSLGDLLQPFR
ncbi:collagen alpha-1(I) chain-like, partial [Nomascus leucogenys]|uniref:collagen alpha-1(I) chain-like n=1 Tax=Nomascus leucogenys TaxID=61853 RepID=UPI00122D9F63